MQYLNFFPQADSNGQIQKSFTWINISTKLCSWSWLWISQRVTRIENDYPFAPENLWKLGTLLEARIKTQKYIAY